MKMAQCKRDLPADRGFTLPASLEVKFLANILIQFFCFTKELKQMQKSAEMGSCGQINNERKNLVTIVHFQSPYK